MTFIKAFVQLLSGKEISHPGSLYRYKIIERYGSLIIVDQFDETTIFYSNLMLDDNWEAK